MLPRHATTLTDSDLKACDAIILNDVTTMPADRMPRLAHYVTEGGTLLVFLNGPNVVGQMEALAKLAGAGDELPFLPKSRIDVSHQGKGYLTLTEARYDSPLLKIFKDPAAADLGKIHFSRVFLTTEPDPRAEVLLRFEDGSPAAARRTFGKGNILICNFSPAPTDSDLARQEVFPPLIHEFLKGLTASEPDRRDFTPGGLASTTLDLPVPAGPVTCLSPNSTPETVTVDRVTGAAIMEPVEGIGFHTLLAGGRLAGVIAVNAHPDESDLRAMDPRELESLRKKRPTYAVNAANMNGVADLEALRHARPLWPYCLLLAFLALLLEQAVATFGGRTRISPRA